MKTGDNRGNSTSAHVSIRLQGPTIKTNTHDLDNFFNNSHERIGDYSVTSAINIPEIQGIELWRDNQVWCSDWYLEWIEVTPLSSATTTKFPVLKWIKGGHHYFFQHIDACLPQYELFKEQRQVKLFTMQKEYQLEVKIPGLPAQVNACISRNSLKKNNDTR